MIIGSKKIAAHLRSTASDRVIVIHLKNGIEHAHAAAAPRAELPRHFLFAPMEPISRDLMSTVVLPMLAREFGLASPVQKKTSK